VVGFHPRQCRARQYHPRPPTPSNRSRPYALEHEMRSAVRTQECDLRSPVELSAFERVDDLLRTLRVVVDVCVEDAVVMVVVVAVMRVGVGVRGSCAGRCGMAMVVSVVVVMAWRRS